MTEGLVRQRCLECSAELEHEGNAAPRRGVFLHRFHCHTCGQVYVLPGKSKEVPTFLIKRRHRTTEFTTYAPVPPDSCTFWS